jgi:hypothetical protein
MDSENLPEKRAFKRFTCAIKGECKSSDEKFGQISFHDISLTGANIFSKNYLPRNTQLKIDILAKDNSPLAIEAKVRWSKRDLDLWQIGVAFNKPLPLSLGDVY